MTFCFLCSQCKLHCVWFLLRLCSILDNTLFELSKHVLTDLSSCFELHLTAFSAWLVLDYQMEMFFARVKCDFLKCLLVTYRLTKYGRCWTINWKLLFFFQEKLFLKPNCLLAARNRSQDLLESALTLIYLLFVFVHLIGNVLCQGQMWFSKSY